MRLNSFSFAMSPHNQPRRTDTLESEYQRLLREVFEERICFNKLLGLQVLSLQHDAPRLGFAMRHELIGSYSHGRLHGGVISAVLDTIGGLAVTVAIGEKFNNESAEQVVHRFARIGTIDLRVDYLRPGVGERFEATAQVTRLGGRIASTQMSLLDQEGQVIATGAAAYVVS